MFCLQKRSLNERELPNKGIKLQHKNGLLHPIDHLIISHFATLSNSTPSFNTSLIMKSLFTNMIKELLAYSVYVQQQEQLDNLCFKKANKTNVWNYSEFRLSYFKRSFLSCFWPLCIILYLIQPSTLLYKNSIQLLSTGEIKISIELSKH